LWPVEENEFHVQYSEDEEHVGPPVCVVFQPAIVVADQAQDFLQVPTFY
jgi:hypothetical protein